MVAASELPSPSDRGKRKDIGGWKLTEPHYQKLPRQAVNSSSVGVQQGKMPRHHFSVSALCHSGTVVDCVLIINKLVCLSNIQFLFPGSHLCSC